MRALTLLLSLSLLSTTCTRAQAQPQRPQAPVPDVRPEAPTDAGVPATLAPGFPSFPRSPRATASAEFSRAWGDGRAELSGYRAVVPRYGERRVAEVMLLYVTEPMNRRTWIKDDGASPEDRVEVIKLNYSLKFITGVYPYSVLTSVFSPVDLFRDERFSPVKITLSAQEWCGHVFHGVWPGHDRFTSQLFSYFASEGESRVEVTVPPGAVYEDALLIQLRELSGPFALGRDWQGDIVPSLWRSRRAHHPLQSVTGTIHRSRVTVDAQPAHRFEVRYEDYTRTLDIEAGGAHRVLGWTSSDGDDVHILRTQRLPYWQLNHNADVPMRAMIGLDVPRTDLPPAPAGQHIGN